MGSRGKAPVGGLGDEVPQKLELFCEISVQILVSDEKMPYDQAQVFWINQTSEKHNVGLSSEIVVNG